MSENKLPSEIRIAAVMPTYNEPEMVRESAISLINGTSLHLDLFVINAGDPLPEMEVPIIEVKVPDNYFWTACTKEGFERIKEKGGYDYVMLANADAAMLPNTLEFLIETAKANPQCVICCPAYLKVGDEEPKLAYAGQEDLGILRYGRMMRGWETPAEAPKSPYYVDLTGGQCVIFPFAWLEWLTPDPENFPQVAGDHDMWLQARARGIRLLADPRGGVVNLRPMSIFAGKGFRKVVKRIFSSMTSVMAPQSAVIMWRLRRKHLGLLLAIPSFVISFLMRWTIGFPGILRRSRG